MIKIVLLVLLIICTTLLGNWFSLRLRSRTNTLSAFISGITNLKTLICFGGFEIDRAIEESFQPVFSYNSDMEYNGSWDIYEFWCAQVQNIPKSSGINRGDRKLLCDFGKNLGLTDLEGQINNCELYCTLLSDRLKSSKEEENCKVRLYRIMGFSLGCVVALVIL